MIVSPDKSGRVDGVVHNIIRHIQTDATLVPVTKLDGFVFNEDLYDHDKIIILDYCEHGANEWDRKETPLFGVNAEKFGFDTDEWKRFNAFVADKKPLYFKRELLLKDFKNKYHPIEYPCYFSPTVNDKPDITLAETIEILKQTGNIVTRKEEPDFTMQTKEQFDSRPIELLNVWGYSHAGRKMLHGNIFTHSDKFGYEVVDNFHHFQGTFNDGHKRIWATINAPHFNRTPIYQVLALNGMSKLSVSWEGAGVKCFRSTGESPLNSVMVQRENNLAWSFPYIKDVSCIELPMNGTMDSIRGINVGTKELEIINEATKRTDLYEIYLRGVSNTENYYMPTYINNYILPLINKYE